MSNHTLRRTALAAALLLGLTACTSGDQSGGGASPGLEPAVATTVSERFASDVAPSDGQGTLLTTPGDASWWPLVLSMAPELELTDVTAPADAAWFGFSHVAAQDQGARESFRTVYARFADDGAAQAFAADARDKARTIKRLGQLVEITSSAVDRTTESFDDEAARAAGATDLTIEEATWTVRFDTEAELATTASSHPDELGGFFAALGVEEEPVTWTGHADSPEGPWTGTVEGLGDVDIAAAASSLIGDDAGTQANAMGFALAMRLEGPSGSYGLLPVDQELEADDVVLAGAVDPRRWMTAVSGSAGADSGDLSRIEFTLDDDTLTLHPVLATASQS